MKTIIMTLLFSSSLFAQTSLEQCELAGSSFGSQRAIPTKIKDECKDLITSSTNEAQRDITNDQLIESYAINNLILLKFFELNSEGKRNLKKEHFISGENSKLSNILASKLNTTDSKVYVLNTSGNSYQIYSYFYQSGGNIAPARKLITDKIQSASNFCIDEDDNKLIVISQEEAYIRVFERDADPDGPRSTNSTAMIKEIKGIQTQLSSPIAIASDKDNYYVLERDQILVYSKSTQGNASPVRKIYGANTELSNAVNIKISSGMIYITNRDKTTLKYNKNANGDISPTLD